MKNSRFVVKLINLCEEGKPYLTFDVYDTKLKETLCNCYDNHVAAMLCRLLDEHCGGKDDER